MYQRMPDDSYSKESCEGNFESGNNQLNPWEFYRELKADGFKQTSTHDGCENIANNWHGECRVITSADEQTITNDGWDIVADIGAHAIPDTKRPEPVFRTYKQTNSNSSGCCNRNNKNVGMSLSLQFHSPEKQSDDRMEYEIHLANMQGISPSETEASHSYDRLTANRPQGHFQRLQEGCSRNASESHESQSNVFTKDLNTNWTPTFESSNGHQVCPTKNYHAFQVVSNEVPLDDQCDQEVGSCVDRMWCNAIDCDCRNNQWSPFLSPFARRYQKDSFELPIAYDNSGKRRLVDNGPYISPPGLESGLPKSEDFEVLSWDSTAESDFRATYTTFGGNKTNKDESKTEAFNTAPNTPELDLSHLDGWHTAPNTPVTDINDFCIVDPEDVFVNMSGPASPSDQKEKQNIQLVELCRATISDSQVGNHSDSKKEKSKQSISESALNTFTSDMLADLPRCNTDEPKVEHTKLNIVPNDLKKTYATESVPINPPIRSLDESPIIYSADTVEYLVDSETGNAKTCGKGSFGQVYNARFSDPSLYHIPIVVKEFDEEFTNKKEILLEAQRLMYLQDTGYVPICYGMIELTTTDRRSYGIIQEYVGDGTTLEQILWERMKMPSYNWLTIALQCCDGLARFHDKGILLNDIKSNNIIVIFYGNGYVCIKYIDFGLASDMRGRSYKNTKSLEEFVYLAPEVRIGHSRTTVASDIFSLGYMIDQIQKYADVCELKFVVGLCMNENPHCRIPVKAAVRVIEEQMEGLDLFNNDNISD